MKSGVVEELFSLVSSALTLCTAQFMNMSFHHKFFTASILICIVQLIAAVKFSFFFFLEFQSSFVRLHMLRALSRSQEREKMRKRKNEELFLCHALFQAPHFISISFQIITLKQSHRTIPNCHVRNVLFLLCDFEGVSISFISFSIRSKNTYFFAI